MFRYFSQINLRNVHALHEIYTFLIILRSRMGSMPSCFQWGLCLRAFSGVYASMLPNGVYASVLSLCISSSALLAQARAQLSEEQHQGLFGIVIAFSALLTRDRAQQRLVFRTSWERNFGL